MNKYEQDWTSKIPENPLAKPLDDFETLLLRPPACMKFVHSPFGWHTHSANEQFGLLGNDDVYELGQMAWGRGKIRY